MAGHEALSCSVGNDAGEQRYRADRVIVTRDRVVNIVGVAVGVEDGNNRNTELLRLVNSEVLLVGVNHPYRRRGAGHVADTAKGLLQLVAFTALDEQFLLGVTG